MLSAEAAVAVGGDLGGGAGRRVICFAWVSCFNPRRFSGRRLLFAHGLYLFSMWVVSSTLSAASLSSASEPMVADDWSLAGMNEDRELV